jgi:hypothetical protein
MRSIPEEIQDRRASLIVIAITPDAQGAEKVSLTGLAKDCGN